MSGHRPHGSVKSYIVGLVLSIEFTVIPYALLDNKTVTGNALWATLLGYALLQMLVQLFFFLHLGRGPKPLYNVAFYVATVGMILVVTAGSIFIMGSLRHKMVSSDVAKKLAQDEGIAQVGGNATGACQRIGKNHQVIFSGGKASTLVTVAKLCDTLTFINQDNQKLEISFGQDQAHGIYGGEGGLIVSATRPKTITLNETGTYAFHDHRNPDVSGIFSVTK